MKKLTLFLLSYILISKVIGQCSLCTKTASQLGEESAQGLNYAILYLMLTPLAIMLVIGYRWWKKEKSYFNK